MGDEAHIDFETGSPTDLNKTGVHKYVQDPNTRAWGFQWRINDGPVLQWRPGYEDPHELLAHIKRGGTVIAHNASFERTIWNLLIRRQTGTAHWPDLKPEQQECTMARAMAMNLPAKLENLAVVLGVENQKDMAGNAVMRKMMKPRGVNLDGTYRWWDEGADGAILYDRNMEYCAKDVLCEYDVDKAVPKLSSQEQRVWVFDQVINERGVRFDMPTVRRAVELVEVAKKAADRKMRKLTGGKVRKISDVSNLVKWLNDQGVPCSSLKKGNIKELVFQSDLISNDTAREVITLRKSASKISTAKFAKMLECASDDDRIRFLLAYHGASTGRWAGRLVQPQNFARFDQDNPQERLTVEWLIELLNDYALSIDEVFDTFSAVYEDVLPWLSKALRSMIVAAPGKKLVGGDFSNIEGRVNAWLAGEQWKLDAFVAYDKGEGPDLYKLSYSRSFGKSIDDVAREERQVGKVQELASGYQGGVGAYLSMCDTYDLEVYTLCVTVHDGAPADLWDETAEGYESASDKHGLRKFEWTALKLLVNGWRKAHPAIVQSWWDYQDAAIAAIASPGTPVDVADMSANSCMTKGRVRYMSDGNYLYCCLPNGRVISYAKPGLEYVQTEVTRADGTTYLRTSTKIFYYGVNSYTKKWEKLSLYGGLLCENITQAVSRDILVESMFRVEERGYPMVLTVHDENLTEPDANFGSEAEFKEIMEQPCGWAPGLPVTVSAWEADRYVK